MVVNSHYEQLFLEIKERNMRNRIQGFEVTNTKDKDGNVTQKKSIRKDAIEAMRNAGMTPEQITEIDKSIFAETHINDGKNFPSLRYRNNFLFYSCYILNH